MLCRKIIIIKSSLSDCVMTVDQVIISIELQQSNRPVYIYYWPGLNACRKTHIALTFPNRGFDANFTSGGGACFQSWLQLELSRLRLLYYVDLCEDCIVIAAISVFVLLFQPRSNWSLQMKRNVFDYPLARNKSELHGRSKRQLQRLVTAVSFK